MSKLSKHFYEKFYSKPLEQFFRDYWKDEAAVTVLMHEIKQRLEKNPEDQEKFLEFVNTDRELQALLIQSLLTGEDFLLFLQNEPGFFSDLLEGILKNPVLQKPLITAMIEQELLQKQFYSWLKADSEHVRRFVIYLEKENALTKDFTDFAMRRKLVGRESFIRWINHDEKNLEDYLQFLNNTPELQQRFYDFLLKLGVAQEIVKDWLLADDGRLRSYVFSLMKEEKVRTRLTQIILQDERGREEAVKMAMRTTKPLDQFLSWLNEGEGNQRRLLAELRSNSALREGLFALLQSDVELRAEMNHTLWQDVGVVNEFLDYIGGDAEKRKAFLRELNARDSYRSALNIMHEKEITSGLTYALPTVTSSFPRSGSNFFQSVLRGSSGLQCISLYHPQYPVEQVYNLKSHALTPQGLLREFADMVPYELEYPQKIIYLKRDPRDVMISLYEFACHNHGQDFPMETFLDMNYYYIANPPGKRNVKNIFYLPGPETCTVAEAYRLFTKAHFMDQEYPFPAETLLLSYEGMVEDPQATFQRAFTFLDLACELNPEFIRLKVSQYSESTRKRGIAYGWKQPENYENYRVIIEQAKEKLNNEIDFLEYNQQG